MRIFPHHGSAWNRFCRIPCTASARQHVLSHLLHLFGPDLDLDALTFRPDNRGVQGLIHVGLRDGNIILELTGNRLPNGVNQASTE